MKVFDHRYETSNGIVTNKEVDHMNKKEGCDKEKYEKIWHKNTLTTCHNLKKRVMLRCGEGGIKAFTLHTDYIIAIKRFLFCTFLNMIYLDWVAQNSG